MFKEESQKREFAEKLESLLHRAYHLQEEFGSSLPSDSMLLDLGMGAALGMPVSCLLLGLSCKLGSDVVTKCPLWGWEGEMESTGAKRNGST